MANPTLLTMPLCIDADKNAIPPTDAGTSGLFSEQYGWQDINSLPLASGGKAPNRRDFNGVFALLGGIAYACQRGFTFEWVATQNYVVGCVVLDTNNNKRYECIADVSANATPPNADTTHWKEFGADMTMLANTDLSNLTAVGLNAFATKTLSNLDTNNLSVHVVVDSYHDAEGNWYRKYSDGWVEQGGINIPSGDDYNVAVSFLKAYKDTNYTLLVSAPILDGAASPSSAITAASTVMMMVGGGTNRQTNTGFYLNALYKSNPKGWGPTKWYACGMGANV